MSESEIEYRDESEASGLYLLRRLPDGRTIEVQRLLFGRARVVLRSASDHDHSF